MVKRKLLQLIQSIGPVILLLLAWEFASRRLVPIERRPLFPPPSQCAVALVHWAKAEGMATDLLVSGKRLAAGFLIGAFAGIVMGMLTGRSRVAGALLSPVFNLMRPLTPVALIPLFILWFGIDDRAKALTISYAVFFPVWLSTHTGIRNIPQRLLWSASTLTQSRWKMAIRVLLPAALPSVIVGLRLGVGVAFTMVFVSELVGAEAGIGYKISIWQLAYRMDSMLAGLVVLGTCGALADIIFTGVVYLLFPWMRLMDVTNTNTDSGAEMMISRRRLSKVSS